MEIQAVVYGTLRQVKSENVQNLAWILGKTNAPCLLAPPEHFYLHDTGDQGTPESGQLAQVVGACPSDKATARPSGLRLLAGSGPDFQHLY